MRHKNNQRYSEKLRDPRWQKLRLQIFERDKFMCQSCGDTRAELQVHHKAYVNGCEPWECEPETLITLCADCHSLVTDCKREIGKQLHNPDYRIVLSYAHRLMTSEHAESFRDIMFSICADLSHFDSFAQIIMKADDLRCKGFHAGIEAESNRQTNKTTNEQNAPDRTTP